MIARLAGRFTFLRAVFHALPLRSSAILALTGFTTLATAMAGLPALAQETRQRPVEVLASPILGFRVADNETRFGALRFVGGLKLESGDKEFGGFSGIRLLPDRARFVAVTDAGQWLAGTIDRDAAGLPRGLTATMMGPLVPGDASFIERKRNADCEGIDIDGDLAILSYERNDRIETWTLADGVPVAGSARVLADMKRMRLATNKGIEAVVRFPTASPHAGKLLAISEESLNRQRNIRAFMLDGQTTAELAFVKDGDFAITDADFLPNGDLLVLERAYSMRKGQAMRLRLVPAAELAEGSIATGSILLAADKTYWIDNMEGMDVSSDEDGRVHVTLISDDNFSALQRTLLLEFVLE